MDKGDGSIMENSGIFSSTDNASQKNPKVSRAVIVLAATVIVLAGIKAANVLIGPMLLALFIAIILLVPLHWLLDRGVHKFLAYPFVILCTAALFICVIHVVGTSLNDFLRDIPKHRDRFIERFDELEAQFTEYTARLGFMVGEGNNMHTPEHEEPAPVVHEPIAPPPPVIVTEPQQTNDGIEYGYWPGVLEIDEDEELPAYPDPMEEVIALAEALDQRGLAPITIQPSTVAAWFAWGMLYLKNVLAGGFLVLIFTIFMLFEAAHLPKKVERAFGKDGPINLDHFHRIAAEVRRYLFLKTISSLMSAVAAFGVYYAFGVPGALFWGIIAFFMYFIPNLGGTLAAIPPGILIFVEGGIYAVLLYAMVLIVVECFIAYGIEPKLLGHGLRLSLLALILSLFFWGFLLGPIGLFLAAPMTVVVKIIFQAFPETRRFAIFLDKG